LRNMGGEYISLNLPAKTVVRPKLLPNYQYPHVG